MAGVSVAPAYQPADGAATAPDRAPLPRNSLIHAGGSRCCLAERLIHRFGDSAYADQALQGRPKEHPVVAVTSPRFKENAARALADPGLQKALGTAKGAFLARRAAAVEALPEFERLREIGRDIKNHTLAHLDFYLETYAANVEKAGGTVHWCSTAEEARAAVLAICRNAGAKTVTKGKSMISEEIALNDHLEANGITPIETDLGEYIIQLRREHPSHIIAPAFHLNREDWEADFRRAHTDLPADRVFAERRDILSEARSRLR
ncbi:MAG: LUD domain-containing protein, partial [Acetobacteraceae bacterium]|nr:LUD domain-containing protein [Acetobacteraceae bacterium]